MADGLLQPLCNPETGFLASILYPLRGAESLAIVAAMCIFFWIFTVLIPEYCLGVWNDASNLGTPSMGILVILISALPAFLLLPLILIYTLQYLGRVLVSSAKGETVPPRLPDRNFDGLLQGLSPWCVWMVFGIALGPLPLLLYALWADPTNPSRYLYLSSLFLLGLPYIQVALIMSFLHDRPLAALAPSVITTLLCHARSFLPTHLKTWPVVGLPALVIVLTFALREGYFGVYLLMALACWGFVIWCSIVMMRILGLYYFHHKDSLNWNHSSPRWGITWRL
jgi:hypothetical protein